MSDVLYTWVTLPVPARTLLWTVCLAAAALVSPGRAEESFQRRSIRLPDRGICAHRGANDSHPENTLAAFREALRLGAHMIEFDVALTRDGQLVLMHDATVDRTTNGTGNVSALTLAELKKLDAGSWKGPQFRSEPVPTLDEALAMMPLNIWLNVHLKGGAELGQRVARRVVAQNRLHQAFLACGTAAARAAKTVEPRIKICNMQRQSNALQYVESTIAMRADFIQLLGSRGLDPGLLSRLRKNHVRINYFGTNDPRQLRKLLDMGVEFPLTDHASAMLQAAEQLGISRLKPKWKK